MRLRMRGSQSHLLQSHHWSLNTVVSTMNNQLPKRVFSYPLFPGFESATESATESAAEKVLLYLPFSRSATNRLPKKYFCIYCFLASDQLPNRLPKKYFCIYRFLVQLRISYQKGILISSFVSSRLRTSLNNKHFRI